MLLSLGASAILGVTRAVPAQAETDPPPSPRVTTGAVALATTAFAQLAGQRVGLVTNQTGLVGRDHLADLMHRAPGVDLVAIFAPEHGFRGSVEAGAKVAHGRDSRTGVRVLSLYGATRRPTPDMLRDIDVLVFDIQDVGVRFYTYISTMGLAMQAAAAARIPFLVLDRPNPIGGIDVSGFVLEPAFKSFVGQYPIPIVHGMTVGELALMIKGERWLDGLDELDLRVVELNGWTRAMRWPRTGLAWTPTSPNIPTFVSALVYPGMGLVGETLVNEGRGTPTPFEQFGAPWLPADEVARDLDGSGLPGVRFETIRYTPRSIPDIAANPRFRDMQIAGVRLLVTDAETYRPLEVGMHVLAALTRSSRASGERLFDKLKMFRLTSGTARLHDMLVRGKDGADLTAAWQTEVEHFRERRARYLIYQR